MKILYQPSVFAAEIDLKFLKNRSTEELKYFFHDIVLGLFRVSGIDDRIVGHIKIYSEGKNGLCVRANLTGNVKNLTVITNSNREERELKIWINIITFMVKKEELIKKAEDTIVNFLKNNKKIKSFKLHIPDTHKEHQKSS